MARECGGVVGVGKVHAFDFFEAEPTLVLHHVSDADVVGEREVGIGAVEIEAELVVYDDALYAVYVKDDGVAVSVGPAGADKVGGAFDHDIAAIVVDGLDVFFLAGSHAQQQGGGYYKDWSFHIIVL